MLQVGRLGNQLSSYVNLLVVARSFALLPLVPRVVRDTAAAMLQLVFTELLGLSSSSCSCSLPIYSISLANMIYETVFKSIVW